MLPRAASFSGADEIYTRPDKYAMAGLSQLRISSTLVLLHVVYELRRHHQHSYPSFQDFPTTLVQIHLNQPSLVGQLSQASNERYC